MEKKNTKQRLFEIMARVAPNFKIKLNEMWGQEFITGHAKGQLEQDKGKIIADINDGIEKLVKYPTRAGFNGGTPERNKELLLKQAEEDNWKGNVVGVKSQSDGKIYIIYKKGVTGLQTVGGGAASGTRVLGNY